MNPTESEGDERPKRGVLRNTTHHFYSVQHLLNQNPVHPFLFDLTKDAPDRIFVVQIQSYCTNIGLMQDTGGCKFCGHWKSHTPGDFDSLNTRASQATGGLRDVERGQHRAAFFRG